MSVKQGKMASLVLGREGQDEISDARQKCMGLQFINSKVISDKIIMGPRQSLQQRSKEKELLDSYEIIQELPNDNIRFLEHKVSKKEYLLRELTFTSKSEYLKAIETVKNKRQQLKNSDHLCPLTQYFEKEEDQYCSTFYKLYVLYQYPQRTLDDQINERNLRKNSFTETELWSILASCILGLSHLQKKGIRHASLRSNMIFLSQEGLIKISDPFTNGSPTNYETLLNKRNTRHIYLSPEQCQALQGELISPANINPYKSDIFTLGMIILECGLLQYQDECYRDEYSRIHLQTLEYNKNRFRKNYSEELSNMLNYMLAEDANTRPEWIELENYVITDSSKSFISEGRKSNIFAQSKPVSVNLQQKSTVYDGNSNGPNSQSVINAQSSISQPSKNPLSQKPNPGLNTAYPVSNVSNRGIGLSSSKPVSVQKFAPAQIQTSTFVPSFPVESKIVSTEYRPSIKTQLETSSHLTNFKTSLPPYKVYENIQPSWPSTNLPLTSTNVPNFAKTAFIAQSPVKNQILSKNFDISPLNPSNISTTRPFRSVFPNPVYVTKTKVDQNLVQVDEDEQTSRSISDLSQHNNLPTQNQKGQNLVMNGNYNFNSVSQTANESPFHTINYNHQHSVANFTAQSGNLPSSNFSHEVSQQNSPPHNKFIESQGEFVIETFKLGSRYEGYKLNGMRHGKGKFYYQDGGMYDGEWVQNKMQGYGKLYYQSGKIAYDGMWVRDQFTGRGILYNENPDPLSEPFNYENFDNIEEFWTKYEGEFFEDSKNGKGVLYLSNGEYFEGNFLNDTAQGEGVYTTMSGKKVRGVWEMNLLEKQF